MLVKIRGEEYMRYLEDIDGIDNIKWFEWVLTLNNEGTPRYKLKEIYSPEDSIILEALYEDLLISSITPKLPII